MKSTMNAAKVGNRMTITSRMNRRHVKKYTSIRVVKANVNRNAWNIPIVIMMICCNTDDAASERLIPSITRNKKQMRYEYPIIRRAIL